MPVTSISPNPVVQQAQSVKKSDAAQARKQAEIRETNKVNERKADAVQNARIEKAQMQQEAAKATVNTNGQKIGTRINTAA